MILPNTAESQKVHIVAAMSFTEDNSDVVYVTRFSDSQVPAASVSLKGHLKRFSGTTQSISPGQRKATIGQLSFTLNNINGDVSALLNSKLNNNKGLRKKRVRYYIGYDDQTWDEYQLVQTQFFHKSIKQVGAQYRFLSKDIQRSTVNKIFVNKKTTLNATISDTDTLITVDDASIFELVAHDASYNDAPNQSVFYIKMDDEVIRCSGTSNNDIIVDTDGRGVLGTKAAIHEVDPNADANRRLSVTEFIYLEGSIPKLIWAILTGQLLNQAQGLPSHWTLNVDTNFVNLQDFLNIGNDLWDFDDATVGRFASYEGLESISGKKFLEEQLLIQGGLYMPIGADGALKLKRITGVLSSSVGITTLDPSNIVDHSDLNYDTGDIFNKVVIDWGYSHVEEKFIRSNILVDQNSIDIWGETTQPKFLEMRGLTGNRHSDEDLARMFAAFRDRYAGPPLRIDVTCIPSFNYLEVGDVINLQHPNIQDFLTDLPIDRSFEVQQVNINWQTGKVSYSLYASSQKATPIAVTSVTSNVISQAAYISEGTELSTVLTINVVGDVGRIQANGTLSGSTDMTNSNAIYYYDGDLQLDAGFTINITENVQLRVNGHFQLNGTINGKGLGLTGIAAPADLPFLVPTSYTWAQSGANLSPGQAGYLGTTIPMGGLVAIVGNINYPSIGASFTGGGTFYVPLASVGKKRTTPANIAIGKVNKIPDDLNIKTENDVILNVPIDLRGTSGGHGAPTVGHNNDGVIFSKSGGNGGNGGSGLFILSQGLTRGGSGDINLSGNDGSLGGTHAFSPAYPFGSFSSNAGSGAGGAAGGLVICIDGASSAIPSLTATNINIFHGISPIPALPSRSSSGQFYKWPEDSAGNPSSEVHSFYSGVPFNTTNSYDAHYLLTYVQSDQGIEIDIPPFTSDATSISQVIFPNTPKSPNADLCTIEVTVTPPSGIGHYSHSNIYFKTILQEDWTLAGPADPVFPIEVAANGTIYDIQARSVSINGNESPAGPQLQVTTPDVDAATTSNGITTDPAIPDPIIIVPNVRHLRLAEDDLTGNLTEFTGKHAKFLWSDSSDSEWFEVGSEPLTRGAEAGTRDQYFSHYQILVYDVETGQQVWEDTTTINAYDYTFEKNFESRGATAVGPFRQFRVEVWRWSRLNTKSAAAASITVSNPAPNLPSNLSVTPRFSSFSIAFDEPTDPDYEGMRVWVETVTSFTPDDTNLAFDGPGNPITIDSLTNNIKIESGTTYYIRFAPFDAFGRTDLNQSSEFVVLTEQIETVDISGLGPWAFEVDPVDRAFIEANLAGDAVPSEKIVNLTAAKLTTGVLLATIEIQSGGLIKATNTGTDYEIRMGFEVDEGINYILRYGDFTSASGQSGASDMPFTIDADGNISMSGNIEIRGGVADIVLDANNAQFYINDGQFGNQGIQLQYNSGTPRFYVGDGSNKFFLFDGTDVLLGRDTEVSGSDAFNNQNIYYATHFDSLDGFAQATSGSGAINISPSNGSVELICGTATGTSKLEKYVRILIPGFYTRTWEDVSTRLKFIYQTGSFATGTVTSYIGVGDPTSKFVGIKIIRVDTTETVFAVSVNSGIESALDITAEAGVGGSIEVRLIPLQKLEIYSITTLVGTISTNIPTGAIASGNIFYADMNLSVVSSATYNMTIGGVKFLQDTTVAPDFFPD